MLQYALNTFTDIVFNAFETYTIYLYYGIFFVHRNDRRSFTAAVVTCTTGFQFCIYALFPTYDLPRLLFTAAVDLGMCCLAYKGKWVKRIVLTILYYIFISIVEALIVTVMVNMVSTYDAGSAMRDYSPQMLAITMVVRLLEFALIVFIKALKGRRCLHQQQHWRALLLMPILTIAFILLVYPRFWGIGDDRLDRFLMFLSAFFLLQNIFIFAYVAAYQSSTEQYVAMKAAYDQQKQYHTAVSAIQNTVRKMAHDMRHHFIYLTAAIEEGNLPKAHDYLVNLDENLKDLIPVKITGNHDIDAIIYGKAKEAAKKNIRVRVEGELPAELAVPAMDLNMLLGNALANAIEAAELVRIPQREILVVFGCNASRLSVIVTNPYDETAGKRTHMPFFPTRAHQGLGMGIMREIVQNYGGMLMTDKNGRQFTLTAMLQIPDMRSKPKAPTETNGRTENSDAKCVNFR